MSTVQLMPQNEPYAVIESITPQWAERFLARKFEGQRKVRKSAVDRYAKDMAEGRWRFTCEPFGIDEFGYGCEGQHRALAVVQSGVTIRAWVIYNQPRNSFTAVGQGGTRSAVDMAHYGGIHATFAMTSIAAHMREGFRYHTAPSKLAILETLQLHRTAIEWVLTRMTVRARGLRQASVLAPVSRAYYSQSHDRLTEFLDVLNTGMSGGQLQPGDEGAVLLRNWLLTMIGGSSGSRKKVVYAKTSRALEAFCKFQKLDKLYAATHEIFLLPEEQTTVDAETNSK